MGVDRDTSLHRFEALPDRAASNCSQLPWESWVGDGSVWSSAGRPFQVAFTERGPWVGGGELRVRPCRTCQEECPKRLVSAAGVIALGLAVQARSGLSAQ